MSVPPRLNTSEQIIYDNLIKKFGPKLLKRARERCVQVIVSPTASSGIKIKAAAFALTKAGETNKKSRT